MPQELQQVTTKTNVTAAVIIAAAIVIGGGAFAFAFLSRQPTKQEVQKVNDTATSVTSTVVASTLKVEVVATASTIAPGDTFYLTLKTSTPPASTPIQWARFLMTGLTSDLVDTSNADVPTTLVQTGTLTQDGWTATRNFCPSPTCDPNRWDPIRDGTGMVVVMATGTNPVSTAGDFVKVKVVTKTDARPGTYTFNLLPVQNDKMFGPIPNSDVYIIPATFSVNVRPANRPPREFTPESAVLNDETAAATMTATLQSSTPIAAAGNSFTLSLNITTPPQAIGSFYGLVTGLTSDLIDTDKRTSRTVLDTVGTLTASGWAKQYNFCPGPTCTRWNPIVPGSSGMVVIMATATDNVTSAGTFVKVQVKTKSDARPGTYTFSLLPINATELFGTIPVADVTIVPATVKVPLPSGRGGDQEQTP